MNLVEHLSTLLQKPPSDLTPDTEQSAWQTDTSLDNAHVLLATKVEQALAGDPDPALRKARIRAEAFVDVVQLSGRVGSWEVMDKAVAIAGEVQGVTSIKNCIQVG